MHHCIIALLTFCTRPAVKNIHPCQTIDTHKITTRTPPLTTQLLTELRLQGYDMSRGRLLVAQLAQLELNPQLAPANETQRQYKLVLKALPKNAAPEEQHTCTPIKLIFSVLGRDLCYYLELQLHWNQPKRLSWALA